jgi:hypothetical protein
MQISKSNGRARRFASNVAVYALITAGSLAVADIALIALGLFPPPYAPGDAALGWTAGRATGEVYEDGCTDLTSGKQVLYTRNEEGIRSSRSAAVLRNNDGTVKIAVSGDSHTELCAPNEQVHFGVLERALTTAGVAAATFSNGAGKYSPLQAYLAVKQPIADYEASVLVLNLYTGNDFHDMLRVDDRPYFVPAPGGYKIAEPMWYQMDSPDVRPRSRVLYAIASLANGTGVPQTLVRLRYLREIAAAQGEGVSSVLGYMNDLRRSSAPEVGYPGAFTAQMLNQQLFFHRFPQSREESLRRVRALLDMIRREHPGVLLVMSPIPSWQLVHAEPADSVFLRTLERLPLTYEGGVADEHGLYEALRKDAGEAGWLFVDTLERLRAYSGAVPLYNTFDYHIEPVASEIIGRAQAEVIMPHVPTLR